MNDTSIKLANHQLAYIKTTRMLKNMRTITVLCFLFSSKTMKVCIKSDNGLAPRLIENNDLALRARSLFSISLGA